MEKKRLAAYAITVGLFLLSLGLLVAGSEKAMEDFPVRDSLPADVGSYAGTGIFFCQNDQCLKVIEESVLDGGDSCPTCQGALDPISLGEKRLLPGDTVIFKRQYKKAGADPISVSVVVGGKERRSIHDPRRCIVAQGYRIISRRLFKVALPERPPLEVMLLKTIPNRPSGGGSSAGYYYAYWFVSATDETAHGYRRILGTAWNAVVHNSQMRWAYIAISLSSGGSDASVESTLSDFIRKLYPEVITARR